MQYYDYDDFKYPAPPENAFYQIGGGLILFAFMVIIHPIYYAFSWLTDYYPMIPGKVLEIFADPKHPHFNLTLKNLLLGQLIYNALMVFLCVGLVYLFFTKKAVFPKAFVAIHSSYLLIDMYYGVKISVFFSYAHFWSREQAWWTVLQISVILIGGGYLFFADRCRRTFWV